MSTLNFKDEIQSELDKASIDAKVICLKIEKEDYKVLIDRSWYDAPSLLNYLRGKRLYDLI